MSRTRKILVSVIALGVLGVGAVYVWLVFVRDEALPALVSADLDDALDGTVASSLPDTAAPDATETAPTAPTVPTALDSVDGVWNISSDSTLGYRVKEVLGGLDTEGTGRTNDVAGTLTIEGSTATAAQFTVQMASLKSDSDRRDDQVNSRIMSTDEFPTATFALTSPIDFGSVPTDGATITASATGDLTLHGVTREVTFDLEAKLDGTRIGVLGSIPILFSEYEIPDPSTSLAKVKDNGLLEFVLVFDKA